MGDSAPFYACVCCGGFCLSGIIALIVVTTAWVHLGPNEQCLFRPNKGKDTVINGPYSAYHGLSNKVFRKATLLKANEYLILQSTKSGNGTQFTVAGPTLYFLDAYEKIIGDVRNKQSLGFDEYVRLVNRYSGYERIVRGPSSVYAGVSEEMPRGIQKGIFIDTETALIVQNKATASRRLVTDPGIFCPSATEEILTVRPLVRIDPHEAAVVRGRDGTTTIYTGDPDITGVGITQSAAFFLEPNAQIVRMYWSNFGDPDNARGIYTTTSGPSTTNRFANRRLQGAPTRRRRRRRRGVTYVPKVYQCTAAACYWSSYRKIPVYNWDWRFAGGDGKKPLSKSYEDCKDECNRLVGCTGFEWTGDSSYCVLWKLRSCDVRTRESNAGWHVYEWHSVVATVPGQRAPALTCSALQANEDPWLGSRSSAAATRLVWITQVPDPWGDTINGYYEYQASTARGSAPTFRKQMTGDEPPGSGQMWLFYSTTGRWWVGNESVKATLDGAGGMMRSSVCLPGRMPESNLEWQFPPFNLFESAGAVRMQRVRTAQILRPDDIVGARKAITRIDLRAQKIFYSYECRTNDNVRIQLEGTVFWQIFDVRKVLNATMDPEGDVWYRSRSSLINVVSALSLQLFMADVAGAGIQAFNAQLSDSYYDTRGIEVKYMELTGITYLDWQTVQSQNTVITQTTASMIRLTRTESDNDIKAVNLDANIILARKNAELIEVQARNTNRLAEMVGTSEGGLLAMTVTAFVAQLEATVPSMAERLEMYKQYVARQASLNHTKELFAGTAQLFVPTVGFSMRVDTDKPALNP